MSATRLAVSSLSGQRAATDLIREAKSVLASGADALTLDFADCRRVYPNGVAPLAAVIALLREQGMTVECKNLTSLLRRTSIDQPASATKRNLDRQPTHWNNVWKFSDSDQIFALTKALIEDLIERIQFGPGVLEALSWCLYEILDNVLQHARIGYGFIMLQHLEATRRLAVTIADAGIGIHRSFAEGGHFRPALASDALELAVRAWTSSTGEPRGNGLFGLEQVVNTNIGTLDLRSGRGLLHCSAGQRFSEQLPRSEQLVVDADHHCTVVDFQLSILNPVHIENVLGMHVTNLEIEPLMDDHGVVVVPIRDYANKVATREGALALRVRLLNYLAEGAPRIALDFDGVGVISSSFADETIGRLVEYYGVDRFFELFSFRNPSAVNQSLLTRAITARSPK